MKKFVRRKSKAAVASINWNMIYGFLFFYFIMSVTAAYIFTKMFE